MTTPSFYETSLSNPKLSPIHTNLEFLKLTATHNHRNLKYNTLHRHRFLKPLFKTKRPPATSHPPDLPGNPAVLIYIYIRTYKSMKIIGAAECCGSAASKPGQAHVAAAPSSTQAPAMDVLKKPASKLQGILKKPATSRDLALVPYQAAQEEPEDEEAEQDDLQEEDEEEVQEQPQEEAEEEEEEGPSKPFRTTTSSSRRPRTFRRKTSTTSSRSSTRSRSSACGRSLRRAARPTQEPSKPSRTALAQAQARLPGRGACSGGGSSMVESRPSSSSSPPLSSAAPGLQASKLPG